MRSDHFTNQLARLEADLLRAARHASGRGMLGFRDQLRATAASCSSWRAELRDRDLVDDGAPADTRPASAA